MVGQARRRPWSADRTTDAPPVQAKIATAQLTCDGVDEGQLQAFADKRGNAPAQPHDDGTEAEAGGRAMPGAPRARTGPGALE